MNEVLAYYDALASVYMCRTAGSDLPERRRARLQSYYDFLIAGTGVYHNDLVAAISFIHAQAVRSPNEQYVLVVSDSQIVNSCYHIIDDAMVTYPENFKIVSATNDLNIWFRGLRIAHTHFHLSDVDTDAIKSAQAVSQFVTMG